jgi:hypothetical protein
MTPEEIERVAALRNGEAIKKFLRGSPLTADDARRFWGHPRGGRVTREQLDELAALLGRATEAAGEPQTPEGLPTLSYCYGLLNLHRLLRGRFEAEVSAGG